MENKILKYITVSDMSLLNHFNLIEQKLNDWNMKSTQFNI